MVKHINPLVALKAEMLRFASVDEPRRADDVRVTQRVNTERTDRAMTPSLSAVMPTSTMRHARIKGSGYQRHIRQMNARAGR